MNRIEQLLGFLDESPNDAFLLFALAKEYEKSGDQENAFLFYNHLLQVDPSYIGLYYHFGKWYEMAGDFQKALEMYTQGMVVAKSKGDQHAFQELSGARLQIADPDED